MASKSGHHDVVRILLGAGADMNIEDYVSDIMKVHVLLNIFLFAYILLCVL